MDRFSLLAIHATLEAKAMKMYITGISNITSVQIL